MRTLTVGSAMVDTIAVIASDRIEQMTMRNADASFLLLEEGRKTDALEVSTHCGGGAVNAAVAMARLGHDVATMVKLGNDQRAETVLARLAAERISADWVLRDAELPTGASVMLSSHDRNAAIFTYRGSNTRLVVSDLDDRAFAVDLVYIASLSNNSADCFPEIVERARRNGAFVAINPGIRQLSGKSEELIRSLAAVDLIVMNLVEAEALADHLADEALLSPRQAHEPPEGLPEQARRPMRARQSPTPAAFLRRTIGFGPRFAALTLGRHGALLATADDILYCPAVLEAKPAGSAGAGDAFASTLATLLAAGADPAIAMQSAALNAAAVVQFVDTQTGLLDKAGLARRMAQAIDRLTVLRFATQAAMRSR